MLEARFLITVLLKLVNANRRTVSIVVINSKETNEKVRKKTFFG